MLDFDYLQLLAASPPIIGLLLLPRIYVYFFSNSFTKYVTYTCERHFTKHAVVFNKCTEEIQFDND